MKTSIKLGFLTLALVAGLSACTEKAQQAEPAAAETNKIQAFIYSSTSDVVIKPGENDSVIVSCGEGVFTSAEKKFPVYIGRKQGKEAAAQVTLNIEDEDYAFEYNEVVAFAAGQDYAVFEVATTLDFGESAKLVITVPDQFSTAYGTKTQTITVKVDYTWLPAGSVTMSSEWEGASASVAIEKAKEYTDEDGNGLYHLVSPYYYIAPDYCTVEGYHLAFLLDSNYNAVDLYSSSKWIQVENTGYNWIYWDTENYGTYNYFINSTNNYVISCLWSQGTSLYGPAVESFVWDKDFPGKLIDPAEGDGELNKLTFIKAEYDYIVDEYGDPMTVDEVLDEELYTTNKYAFPESYKEHNLFAVTLTTVLDTMYLEVVGDEINGEYTFGTITASGWDNYTGTPGTVVKGEWNGETIDGSYLQTPSSLYYLTDGKVVISATGVTVDAKSASGAAIKGSHSGPVIKIVSAVAGKPARQLVGKL